jgi:hypothetical protein
MAWYCAPSLRRGLFPLPPTDTLAEARGGSLLGGVDGLPPPSPPVPSTASFSCGCGSTLVPSPLLIPNRSSLSPSFVAGTRPLRHFLCFASSRLLILVVLVCSTRQCWQPARACVVLLSSIRIRIQPTAACLVCFARKAAAAAGPALQLSLPASLLCVSICCAVPNRPQPNRPKRPCQLS